jgi:hypothetical protein
MGYHCYPAVARSVGIVRSRTQAMEFLSLLSPSYNILWNIYEIIGDQQCGFRRNRPTMDHIFCIRQIMQKEWEYNMTVHQLFINFKKAYDSVRME